MVEPELIPQEVAEELSVADVGSWKSQFRGGKNIRYRDEPGSMPIGALVGADVATSVWADDVAIHAARSRCRAHSVTTLRAIV